MKKIILLVFAALFVPQIITAQVNVAIFGGSVAQFFKDKGAQKELEKSMPRYNITNFGKAGDGFCKQTKIEGGKAVLGGIPLMVSNQCGDGKKPYDVYILWCSTNDIWGNPVGKSSDYTIEDGYDENKLLTQCGGLNYCIETIQKHAPAAKILVFASLKSFGSPYSYSKTGETRYNPPRRMWNYIEGQMECANRFSVPLLNLWTDSGINELNYKQLCPDGIHPTKDGYLLLCPLFKNFIEAHSGKLK